MQIIDSRITKYYDYYTVELKFKNKWDWFERYIYRLDSEWWGFPQRFYTLEEAKSFRDSEIERQKFVPQVVE